MAKIGDVVRVKESRIPYFTEGCVGTVVSIDRDGDCWVDFGGMKNPEGSFLTSPGGDRPTVWCIGGVEHDLVDPTPTGRYWLFAGPSYYASGGMGDFVGKFDTLPDAVAAGQAHNEAKYSNWWHVLDTTIMKVAAVRQGGYTGFIDAEMLA